MILHCNKCNGNPELDMIKSTKHKEIHKCPVCYCEIIYDECENY